MGTQETTKKWSYLDVFSKSSLKNVDISTFKFSKYKIFIKQ